MELQGPMSALAMHFSGIKDDLQQTLKEMTEKVASYYLTRNCSSSEEEKQHLKQENR